MIKYTTRMWPITNRRFITLGSGTIYKDDVISSRSYNVNFIYHGPDFLDWKARLAEGRDATTLLQGYRYTAKRAHGQYSFTYDPPSKSTFVQSGHLTTAAIPTTAVDPSVINQARTIAITKFTKSFNRKTRNWQSGVFVGELLETAALLTNPARGVRKAIDLLYRDIKNEIRGKKRYSKGYRNAIADTWLEWSLGVSPLVSDLDNAAQAFRGMASGRCFDMIRITGSSSVEKQMETSLIDWFPASEIAGGGKQYYDRVQKSEVTVRGGWKNSNPSGEMPLPMRFGIGIKDIVPTAYNLIPLSFFVDYFANLGDVLDAWSMRFVEFAWLNETARSRQQYTYSDVIANKYAGVTTLSSGGRAVLNRYTVDRSPISNRFDTSFMVKIPGLGGYDTKKWLNVAGLLQKRALPGLR